MSGYKTRTIVVNENEYNRLRARADSSRQANMAAAAEKTRRRNAEREADRQRTRANEQERRNAQLIREMEAQEAAHNRDIQAIRNEVRDSVNQINSAIQTSEQQIQNLQNQQNQTAADLARTRQELNERITQEINSVRQEVNGISEHVSALDRQLNSNAQDYEVLAGMAREYLRQAQVLYRDLQNNYPVDQLCPGRMLPLHQAIENAEADLNVNLHNSNLNAATARSNARVACQAAVQLHADVLVAQAEWNQHYDAARAAVRHAAETADASRTLHLPDEEGQSVDVDVNHWSNGDLNRIRERITSYERNLEQSASAERIPTLEQLDDIAAAAAQAEREAAETSVFAAAAITASQDRWCIADDIYHDLDQRLGLSVVSRGYQGTDQRAGYQIHLKNPATGFEIIITQTPQTNADGTVSNQLESRIISYGTNSAETGELIRRQAEACVRSSLENIDSLDGLSCTPLQENTARQNAAENARAAQEAAHWRQAQAQIPAPVHPHTQAKA